MAASFYRKYLQTPPVLRRVKRAGAKLAKQPGKACGASDDVTLSSAFNALCQPTELGMIELFAILSVHNDYFAIMVTL